MSNTRVHLFYNNRLCYYPRPVEIGQNEMRAAGIDVVRARDHLTKGIFRSQGKIVYRDVGEPVLGDCLGQQMRQVGAWFECINSSICSTLPPAVQFDRWTPSIGLPGRPLTFSPAPALLENHESENRTFCTLPVLVPATIRAPSEPQVSHSKLLNERIYHSLSGAWENAKGIRRVINYVDVVYREAARIEHRDTVPPL